MNNENKNETVLTMMQTIQIEVGVPTDTEATNELRWKLESKFAEFLSDHVMELANEVDGKNWRLIDLQTNVGNFTRYTKAFEY
jgi:hypothetical protein